MPHRFSHNRHKQLAAFGQRLAALWHRFEVLPRKGDAPPELRGEIRRVLDGIVRLAPETGLDSRPLARGRRPQMFDAFYAVLVAILAFKALMAQPKIGRDETYPRSRADR